MAFRLITLVKYRNTSARASAPKKTKKNKNEKRASVQQEDVFGLDQTEPESLFCFIYPKDQLGFIH